jgi:hypothetical protein
MFDYTYIMCVCGEGGKGERALDDLLTGESLVIGPRFALHTSVRKQDAFTLRLLSIINIREKS